jgi:hypothetical protein
MNPDVVPHLSTGEILEYIQKVSCKSILFRIVMIMAPIKRLLSTKNTTPSQKGYLFLQEQISVRRMPYSFTCSRFFFCLLCSVTLSANRHPSGSRPKRGNLKPLVRNRTPEKDRYLVKANWVVTSFRAPFGPAIASL